MPLVQKLRGSKKRYSSVELTAARIERQVQTPASFEPPSLKGVTVERTDVAGWPVFTVSTSSTTGRGSRAVYFHGGSFVYEISPQHWTLVADLVRSTGATILVPIYPLAPVATASAIVPLAADLAAEADVILGDSAGGDIALAAAMVVRDRTGRGPRTILISPVLDVGLTDPRVAELEQNDPWLAIAGARYANDLYRGELAATDPLVSPIYGSLEGLGPITLFSGTRDMLNADATRLVALAASVGHDLDYYEAPGMIHVYPLLPIPEAKPARDVMRAVLRPSTGSGVGGTA
jgi:acetyl esterase/lipase